MTRGVNDQIVPALGRKVLEQGVEEDAEGGDVQEEEAKGGSALQNRIVQRKDQTLITEFGVPNDTGGSGDAELGDKSFVFAQDLTQRVKAGEFL